VKPRGREPLPLRVATPRRWAELAAGRLDVFLADHAVCEQQAALAALNLVAHYPEDAELVERMTALAAEEIHHLRRVSGLLRDRALRPARRRANPYVRALREHVRAGREPWLKIDRLLVGALIEARSCERFTLLLEVVGEDDPQLARLLGDLGPAERRHWRLFHRLAAREADGAAIERRWSEWLAREARVVVDLGREPTVHG